MIRLAIAGAAFALVLGAGLFYGHARFEAGQKEVQGRWNEERVIAAVKLAEETARVQLLETKYTRLAKEMEDDLKPRLADATASSADLARRLRNAASRTCSGSAVRLPAPTAPGSSGSAAEPGNGSGLGATVDAAIEAHLGACAQDAVALEGWQEWWMEVQ